MVTHRLRSLTRPVPCRSRALLIGGMFLLLAAAPGSADPYVDTGFTPTTPLPDPDLVIVREAVYGSEGVDLSAYGLGGPHTYVQSIYFRLFVDNDIPTVDSFTGLVLFPEEVTILGFIYDEAPLGGSIDDGAWTESDQTFGIGGDPDRYSENARGFEIGGGVSHSEFIGSITDHSFTFGLNVTNGVDDFRVIIDYGDDFGSELSFDVLAYDVGVLGGAVPTEGIRVGEDTNPLVFGSGDFGETRSLLDIPLTSTTPPIPAGALPYTPLANLYFFRDPGSFSVVDGYDTVYDVPLPDLFPVEENLDTPVEITDGNDGLLYGLGAGGGFAVIDPVTRTVESYLLDDLEGDYTALANLPGEANLFLIRDTSGDSQVDVVDPTTRTIVTSLTVTGATTPVDIADGPDSLLYVLGGGGTLGWLDAAGANTGSITLGQPGGTYAGLTSWPGSRLLYLVRDTAGNTHVDTYDVDTQAITFSLASFAVPGTPIGITDGPDDHLYILGRASVGAAGYMEIDPVDGSVVLNHAFMDFAGANVALTNLAVETVAATPEMPGYRAPGFAHLAAPNPLTTNVEIRYEAPAPVEVQISHFDVQGRLVRTLRDSAPRTGWRRVTWDGRDEPGVMVPSGTYLYRITAGGQVVQGKVQLVQ